MGWTCIPVVFTSRNLQEIKYHLIKEWEVGGNYKVREYSKKSNTVYMAVENLLSKEIFAVVTLISFSEGEFCWKTMDETMGPLHVECPQKILKMLTPTSNEYAKEWRGACWNYHRVNKITASKYQHGDILEFFDPIVFKDGSEETRFIYYKHGHSSYFAFFRGQTDMKRVYPECRIRNWRRLNPRVIGKVGDFNDIRITEDTYIQDLPKRVQEEIIKDLRYVGIQSDINVILKSRISDFKEVINVDYYI